MIRLEVVINHSVEENVMEALAKEEVGKFYTKIPSVFGVGSSGPRMGDAIWPEENLMLIFWCEADEARGIARAIMKVKEQFPDEGVKLFGLPPELEEPAETAEPTADTPAEPSENSEPERL
jgi:hypothetical protein